MLCRVNEWFPTKTIDFSEKTITLNVHDGNGTRHPLDNRQYKYTTWEEHDTILETINNMLIEAGLLVHYPTEVF